MGSMETWEGFQTTATRFARGKSSLSTSRRLASSSPARTAKPVRLPPGRARFDTIFSATGSPEMKTTGTDVVAALTAPTVTGPPVLMMTLDLASSTSLTRFGKLATLPLAQRTSSTRLRPST